MNPLTPTTELEAVNLVMSVIGVLPVDDLRLADTDADVRMALQLLRSGTRALLLRGWKFNTEENVPLYRDPDGTIPLPANCVRCTKAEAAMDQGDVDLVIRGQRLYDRKARSLVWTRDLRCDLTLLLTFEELPEPARNFLTEKVGQKFQARVVGSETLDAFTREDIAEAAVVLSDYELEDGNYNFLTGSADVAFAWARD